ncbi:MAG: RNA polymerase sigma factor [Gammaproteobacteria bacterium]
MGSEVEDRDERYLRAAAEFGPALARFARAYEANADQQHDLLQDIHFALWRSLEKFNGRCSLRTWVYRVAHNVVISTRLRRRHRRAQLVSLHDLVEMEGGENVEQAAGDQQLLARLYRVIRRLKAPDDQVLLLYLEDVDSTAIGEITGLSPGAVATRIHRTKALLARDFRQGEPR